MDEEQDDGRDYILRYINNSNNNIYSSETSVKNLQSLLFPISSPRKSHSAESYLSNSYLKKNQDEESKIANSFLKNRDSKELFTKEFSPLDHVGQPPRWPTECQVLEERVKHIPYKPCPPEPYYMPTGKEVQPKPVGEEVGVIVYQYYPISAVNYFCRSSVGGSKYLLPTCPSPEEDSLRFESRFESGNLAKAIKITANYYELYLRTDLYTNRHMQWYYFRITNMKKNSLYRFSIVNFTKEESLYGQGMRPLMYSVKDSHIHSIGWRRCGTNITYFCNDNVTSEDPDQTQYYTLSFNLEFPHDEDEVYLAHSYPYTYSDLQDYLLDISVHPIKSTYTTLRLLCKTLAGNNVYYVTITNPPSTDESLNKKKKAIVITARVHPGETPSSWMMHGFLEFLTSETSPAKELRDNFIFKLVPMLNPDGVIVGNNRCSLSGKDLNRQYRTVIRETYPSIWYTKLMIRRLMEECGVAMYCDLHAHSRKHNIFIFGCESRRASDRKLYEQVFPLMLHKNASEKFSFQNCKFRIQKCKEGTGRVVMWMMGIANSFTMEASFGGTTLGMRSDTHFNTSDYELMGKSFCQTLLDFYDEDPRKEKLRSKILARLAKEGSNADEPANIKLSDYSSDGGDTTSSSDDDTIKRKNITEFVTAAPPPTPIKTRKSSNQKRVVPKVLNCKSPARKPFEVCRANLSFSVDDRNKYLSDTSSDSENEIKSEKTSKIRRRRKKKKKRNGVKKNGNDDILGNAHQFLNEYSIIDISPDGKFESKILTRKETPIPRSVSLLPGLIGKNSTRKKLDEVQAKLLTLKNKFWFGVGDIEAQTPLSWGFSSNKPESKSPSHQKNTKRNKTNQKKETAKIKDDNKDVVKKNKESLKRQTAIEFNPPIKATKLRKSKSLFENFKRDSKYNRSNTYKGPHLKTFDAKIVEDIDAKDVKIKRKKKPKTAKGVNKLKD